MFEVAPLMGGTPVPQDLKKGIPLVGGFQVSLRDRLAPKNKSAAPTGVK